jgi:hypothetical protein
MKNLTIELIATKTGKVQMGGYYSQKTAEIKIQKADGFDNIYRVGYISDSVDECFKTFEMAFDRYSKICSIIN